MVKDEDKNRKVDTKNKDLKLQKCTSSDELINKEHVNNSK